MDQKIYFIKDELANVKSTVFLSQNDNVALRSLELDIKRMVVEKKHAGLTVLSQSTLWRVDEETNTFVKVKDIKDMIKFDIDASNVNVNHGNKS